MRIAIEAQRIFRPNKHGMDFVALESIKDCRRRITRTSTSYLSVPGRIIACGNPTICVS